MKFLLFISAILAFGCDSSVKPLHLKPLPPSDFAKKTVVIDFSSKDKMYDFTCTRLLEGKLFQLNDGQWIRIYQGFKPEDSFTSFYLDGKFFEHTMWGEGCDQAIYQDFYPKMRVELAIFHELGDKPNPLYKKKSEKDPNEPEMIPSYKTEYLSGHFKVAIEYYTDPNHQSTTPKKKEIEFYVP